MENPVESTMAGLLREVATLSQEEFTAKHPNPFLIVEGENVPAGEIYQGATTLGGDEEEIVEQIHEVVERKDSSAFGFLTIGRSKENHVVINNRQVSKFHAVLHREGEGFTILDVGSSNGTTVNDEPLSARRQRTLAEGNVIVLADKALLRYVGPQDAYEWLRARELRRR